jgi:acetoin utilization deacetylase AcuC-like enzyme
MQIFHDPRCAAYGRPGHPERPERILATVPFLKKEHPDWTWLVPEAATREELLRGHSADYIERVAHARFDFDSDCPAYPDIFEHARRAAGAPISAARVAAETGEHVFSLMRPPGHHATQDAAMGFCYFGNIALAAFDALARGTERVAIWDFDAHHGNGTEALVANKPQILFASIHQYPGWPGTGTRSYANILNYPVAPHSPRGQHTRAAERALEELLKFKPQLLLISAGFDAFVNDPITQMTLEQEDFATFGKWLREIDIPTAAILEGGYSDALPKLIDAFLSTWESPSS